MNQEYKRDLNNNYMILNDEATNAMDDYRVRMLISNKIPFILKCNVRKFDGSVKYYYEITSKHPMNRVFEKKKIGRAELNTLITSFLKVLESSTEYLLNPNDFILEPDYIYMNIETNQVYFCYMPGYEKDIGASFHSLTSYILERIDHEDKHTVATAYELYRQTMNENYSLRDILNSITKEDKKEYEEIKEQEPAQEIDELNFQMEEKKEESKDIKKIKSKGNYVYLLGGVVTMSALLLFSYFLYINRGVMKIIKISDDLLLKAGGVTLIILVIIVYIFYKKYQIRREEESDNLIIMTEDKKVTSIPDHVISLNESESVSNNLPKEEVQNYGNTVLLNYRPVNRRLISSKEKYNSFELTEKSFLVGKMAEHVDGVIQDELISRIHAEIGKRDASYYLTDLNSTNGTFHNDRRLEANETVEIKPEDVIRFATVEYVFR